MNKYTVYTDFDVCYDNVTIEAAGESQDFCRIILDDGSTEIVNIRHITRVCPSNEGEAFVIQM